MFPGAQMEAPVFQCVPIAFCPAGCEGGLGENETNTSVLPSISLSHLLTCKSGPCSKMTPKYIN